MINRKNRSFDHLEFKKYITNCNIRFFGRLSSDVKLVNNKKSWQGLVLTNFFIKLIDIFITKYKRVYLDLTTYRLLA